MFLEIHLRHYFFFHVDCDKSLISQCTLSLPRRSETPGLTAFVVPRTADAISAWVCFVTPVKYKMPEMYLVPDKT